VLAIDAKTGRVFWTYQHAPQEMCCSRATTKVIQALNARTGALLWKASLGAQIASAPITYQVDGKRMSRWSRVCRS
jgi:glucose dehydrogenase